MLSFIIIMPVSIHWVTKICVWTAVVTEPMIQIVMRCRAAIICRERYFMESWITFHRMIISIHKYIVAMLFTANKQLMFSNMMFMNPGIIHAESVLLLNFKRK